MPRTVTCLPHLRLQKLRAVRATPDLLAPYLIARLVVIEKHSQQIQFHIQKSIQLLQCQVRGIENSPSHHPRALWSDF